jgi:para-aminobenzoate synthetase
MSNLGEDLLRKCSEVVAEIQQLLSSYNRPIVVAVDGGSGAGKSILAFWIHSELDSALIPLDDFFSADIPDYQWDEFTVEEKLRYVFDWDRLRHQVIEPLLRGKPATWRAFDFESGLRVDGTYGMQDELKQREPADVILIEGAYSASPELADLVDLAILVEVPVEERHARLEAREEREFLRQWHRIWDEVESHYFTEVRPKGSFDVVVSPE